MEEARLYAGEAERTTRLSELGLSEPILREAVWSGLQHGLACTRHDPPFLSGVLVWGKTVRHLREQLVPSGWLGRDNQNYSTVQNASQTVALAVASGDSGTGDPQSTPTTRHPKGQKTSERVTANQLSLFAQIVDSMPAPQGLGGLQTWLLLIHMDDDREEARMELALPEVMTEGRIRKWTERIILEPWSMKPQPLMSDAGHEPSEEIEVIVQRRSPAIGN